MSFKPKKGDEARDNIQNTVVTERKVLFFIKDFICTETYRRLFQTKNYIEKWNIITL